MPICQTTKRQRVIEPAILYFGTPVVLIGSSNEDGTPNLAPISSAWWLGWRCMLGLARSSKTTENMLRTGECVLNLPSDEMAGAVNRLARTTGSNPVPAGKMMRGYRYEKEKFAEARLTAISGRLELPRRARSNVRCRWKRASIPCTISRPLTDYGAGEASQSRPRSYASMPMNRS